jgi:hypothetical protein
MDEVIVVGMAVGEEVAYTHALTIMKAFKGDNLIISDSSTETFAFWPAKPRG